MDVEQVIVNLNEKLVSIFFFFGTWNENEILLGLPEGAEAKKLTNTLSADGILTIQIPVRDYRPPLTPTYQLSQQQFNLPTSIGTNDSYIVGDQQLKLTFDLSGYKPDDVSVKVNDNVLKGK
jgi:HSP20 family molecular chaperone IbpA